MASSSVRWHGERVAMKVRERMKRRLEAAGRAALRRVRKNISRQAPPHSMPGEFPHRMSGDLARSLHVETDKRSLTVRVVASAPYAESLERSRPFLRRTLREMRSELRAMIIHGTGASGRYKFD